MVEKTEQEPRGRRRYGGPRPPRKQKTRHVWLNVLPDDLWLKVREGTTIYEALQRTHVELESDCGGLGKCGKCKVRVLSSIGPPTEKEQELLDDEELEQGIRLACRTAVSQDMVVHTGEPETEAEYYQILKTGQRPLLHPYPLVGKRLITLPPNLHNEGLSDLDRVKLVMESEEQELTATLNCLQELPSRLRETDFSGAAVLHNDCLLAWQNQEEIARHYGLVFDLGTSTLVGKLISLVDGSEVAVVSCLNSQMKHGSNVISRLQYVKERPRGLRTFHNLLVRDLRLLIRRLLRAGGLKPEDIFIVVAAGNTTMQHFLLNLDPSGIAEAPFSPVLTDGVVVRAAEVDIELHPDALLYVMPMKSGYIGGDLISVIVTSGAAEQEEEMILGLDLGTNGEIFLGNRSRLVTCSAAAGPALEGANISAGMIAKAGAIESVNLQDGDLQYQVIGNIRPMGVCGSGLVEIVALLLEMGIIDHEGAIRRPRRKVARGLSRRVGCKSGVCHFLLASLEESYHNRDIYLTQRDIRELQLAKAAIAAGIEILMEEMGIGLADIDRVYLAGALGNYVDPRSAVRIGLLPDFDRDIVASLGNAASTGASMVLLSKNYWQMTNELADSIEHIELSSRLDFNEHFVENLDFPRGAS
ncbi:MAG: ASKHA domain-containing protein [Chloroflexota bacterium]|nr:ASKHA domain-containing protein [Chloroflexota bacterium]